MTKDRRVPAMLAYPLPIQLSFSFSRLRPR